jgi:hypothetical protein
VQSRLSGKSDAISPRGPEVSPKLWRDSRMRSGRPRGDQPYKESSTPSSIRGFQTLEEGHQTYWNIQSRTGESYSTNSHWWRRGMTRAWAIKSARTMDDGLEDVICFTGNDKSKWTCWTKAIVRIAVASRARDLNGLAGLSTDASKNPKSGCVFLQQMANREIRENSGPQFFDAVVCSPRGRVQKVSNWRP